MTPPNPPSYAKRPPSPDDYDSPGDYLSDDDDLSPADLNALNTDYDMQKNLTFHAPRPRPGDARSVLSPSDSRTRARTTSLDEKHADEHWNRPLRLPPRLSSRDPSIHSGQHSPNAAFAKHKHHNARAYETPNQRRRPLIDYIKNEWAHTTGTSSQLPSPAFDDESEFTTPLWVQACFAPKFQRALLAVLAISFFIWGNWKTWAGSRWNEAAALKWSVQQKQRHSKGWFGENMRPEFFDLVHMQTLDEALVPSEASDNRLIIIGDAHGCYDEVTALLSETQYNSAKDHLIFTGDLIAKGPSSPAVVDLAIAANASCVRGNHEDRVLLAHRDMTTDPLDSQAGSNKNKNATSIPTRPAWGLPPDAETTHQPLDEESFAHGSLTDRLLAHQLSPAQLAYLATCPVILSLGPIDNLASVSVVHAGLVPGVPSTDQDPLSVMSMRTIDLGTHVPSSKPSGVPWWMLWNVYQSSLPITARSTVIYGHDSKRGLNLKKFSYGLDSGCVSGGKLSALVVEGGEAVGRTSVVSVECRDYRHVEKEAIVEHGGGVSRR